MPQATAFPIYDNIQETIAKASNLAQGMEDEGQLQDAIVVYKDTFNYILAELEGLKNTALNVIAEFQHCMSDLAKMSDDEIIKVVGDELKFFNIGDNHE